MKLEPMTRRLFLASTVAAVARAKSGWPLGACTAIEGVSLDQAIRTLKEAGFPAIEIQCMGVPEARPGAYPGFLFDQLPGSLRKHVSRMLKPFRIVTAHLPYTGLDYMSHDLDVRARSIQTMEAAMEGAGYFGARVGVLHPQPLSIEEQEPRWNEYLDRFRTWGDRAKRLGFKLALETGYPTSVRQYLRMIREIDHPNVGSTIDVGHQRAYEELVARVPRDRKSTPEGIRAYNETTFAIAEGLGPKLFHLHVHDIDPVTWAEHKPMVYDFVDYPGLFARLRQVNYQGILIFEFAAPAAEMKELFGVGRQKLRAWM